MRFDPVDSKQLRLWAKVAQDAALAEGDIKEGETAQFFFDELIELSENRLKYLLFYPHQMKLWEGKNEPKDYTMVQGWIAANRVGKSLAVSAIVAIIATGRYPDWWTDVEYETGSQILCCGTSSKQMVETYSKYLFGTVDRRSAQFGTGLIPKECIVPGSVMSGHTSDQVSSIRITHSSGTESIIRFQSYEMSRENLQGSRNRVVFLDEEARDPLIIDEIMRGLATEKDARCYVSETPLMGITPLIDKFLRQEPGYSYVQVGWDEVPDELIPNKDALLASFMPHTVEARTKGVPMMGEGAVFALKIRDECMYDHQLFMSDPNQLRNFAFRFSMPAIWAAILTLRSLSLAF